MIIIESGSCSCHVVDKNTDSEVNVLRAELKQCTDQMEKLTREFSEIKEIEAAQEEVDTTRYALTEITTKLREIL